VTGTGAEVTGALPAGLLVEGSPAAIRAVLPALCALQPVRMGGAGLVCAPRSAPERARPAMAACPLPTRALDHVPGWPDPPADWVAGWYLRSPAHLPAPAGVRALTQAPGEGFGSAGHATTTMCLEALEACPPGPALDAGCGSGLLAQAWAALGRGPVLAIDLDPRALAQAAAGLQAAGRPRRVTLRRGPLGGLGRGDLAERIVLANVPAAAHRELLGRVDPTDPPRAAVLSGLRRGQLADVLGGWAAHGLTAGAVDERGGFCCVTVRR
jgi:ribosomal protein L11 methylase PrmA